ncbi:accessory Sec system S-layer assembly protein [Robertmurraya siralis]|uniref:accessory Sec system S-layer assembly protein n=1 Tax=Robertmurraya siralis TaxID=77777 RepID=UPI0010F86FC8|nr:accessory Sec system S-layer assembly protein [Robertmurraya siralis]
MLSIFKKKDPKDVKRTGLDSSVSSDELMNEKENSVDEEIHTELFVHPSWKLSNEDSYVLRFLNNELPPLKANQLSISGIELNLAEGGIEATAFVRNSLNKGIRFSDIGLILLDSKNEIIARHNFDLSSIGELPGKSSLPWKFLFPANSIKKSEFSKENWTLAFELKAKHALDLDPNWESALPQEEKDKLVKLVDSLQPPKDGEVNFMGLQARFNENGDLHVTILIRNGNEKTINLQQIPLKIEDAANELVAQGGFKLENFEVKANTTKPWTFVFPKELVQKDNPDFSNWRASIAQ